MPARRRATGETWGVLGKQLGINRSTAQAWASTAEQAPDAEPSGAGGNGEFLAVCVDPLPTGSVASGAVLITPTGYRVEGLAGDALIAVLRGLE